jgi:hypothetical protein
MYGRALPGSPQVPGDLPPDMTVGLHRLCGSDVLKVVNHSKVHRSGAVGAKDARFRAVRPLISSRSH